VNDRIKAAVRVRYGRLAQQALHGSPASCCSSTSSCSCPSSCATTDFASLPAGVSGYSLGCGNPPALAGLQPGEVVLDLGCGAGLDVLLAAQKVGPAGKVYGLDMTEEMLELARRNQRASGMANVEFLKGEMEHIPLPSNHVDVVMSNCVLNLSPDKAAALTEAHRVLKPGGRLAFADMMWLSEVPASLRRHLELWTSCVAGALTEAECRHLLEEAGFTDVEIEITHVLDKDELLKLSQAPELQEALAPYAGSLVSAFVRARKPKLTDK